MKLFSILCLMLTVWHVNADEQSLSKLQEVLAPLKTMEADFKQVSEDGRGSVLQTQTGSFVLSKPNRFYWKSEEPFSQLLVSNGETLWVYDEDLEQVTVQQLDPSLTSTPVLLLSGTIDDIRQQYKVYSDTTDGKTTFSLIPKDTSSLFSRLTLYANDQLMITGLMIKDEVGQVTRIEFSSTKNNVDVSPSKFEFTPPKGVDIIQNQQ